MVYYFVLLVFVALLHQSCGWRLPTRLMMSQNDRKSDKNAIFIAGAGSPVGLGIVKKLSTLGSSVNVLLPTTSKVFSAIPGVTVHVGDDLDAQDVQSAMTGCTACITMISGSLTDTEPPAERIDYLGNSNVIEQAGILGVERILLVTNIGCGESKMEMDAAAARVLGPLLEAKTLAERDLKMYTNLDWTIIRPGGLSEGKASGKAILSEDPNAFGHLDIEDFVDLTVRVLKSPAGLCTRKTLMALDPNQQPFCNRPGFPFVKPFELP